MSMLYALMALCLSIDSLPRVMNQATGGTVPTMKRFGFSGIIGRWYEVERSAARAQDFSFKCATVDFSRDANGNPQMVWTSINRRTGYLTSMLGNIYVPNSADRAKMMIKYTGRKVAGNMWILGTDYTTFLVMYDATVRTSGRHSATYIWTRVQRPANSVLVNAHRIVKNCGLGTSYFTKIQQNNCSMKPDRPVRA